MSPAPVHVGVNCSALSLGNLWTPAQNLGFPHETYVTPAFTRHESPRHRLIRFPDVADWQHRAAARDDKAAAAV